MNRQFAIVLAASDFLRFALIAGVALACGGCELIPLATLGAVFDIAGSTVSTGPEIYRLGKLDVALMADYCEVQRAVRLAGADLHLHMSCDRAIGKKGEDIWEFELEDDLKSNIEVTLERRTRMLCRCRVNVGFFGSEPTARLMMNRIEVHLEKPKRSLNDGQPAVFRLA